MLSLLVGKKNTLSNEAILQAHGGSTVFPFALVVANFFMEKK